LTEDRKLVLGGVEIPYIKGLLGHSDGDALLHAISDAMLGALALGDIGTHFPNTDPAYKDISSLELLQRVSELVRGKGYSVNNIDVTVIAEEPKINHFISRMKERISAAIGIEISSVSIKATTNEGVGSLGRNEAIASFAVATLKEG
ncbi:2-C-methyl-D-erythritol 2,4-cyclodiphosphate synthase, partial [Candidatus Omnitrophota bacterium]